MTNEAKAPAVELTRLDRLISYVSPTTALRRLEARARIAFAESMMGGLLTRASGYIGSRSDRRSLKEYSPSAGSALADTLPGLSELRARSRDLVRNSPLAGGAVNTVVTNVVGTGLQLQPRVDRDLLNLGQDEAEAWEHQALRIWRAWSRTKSCDFTRIQDFAGLEDLVLRSVLGSGDVLVVRRFRERQGDVLATKIQLIEADRICNPNGQLDTDRLAGGVEVNGRGEPVRYHVRNTHPGDFFLYRAQPWKWTAVPARGRTSNDEIANLLFDRLRVGQIRGVPYLAPVIEPLKQLLDYREAELTASVIAALFTVFVKTETGEEGLAPLSDDDSITSGTSDYRLGSGSIVDLGRDESIEIADPNRPNTAFDAFVLSVLREIGVGLNLPFEILVKHFTSSYSAARAALLEAWKFFRARREWLARSFCQPAYEWVIGEAVARDMILAPGFDDPVVRQAWLSAQWVGPAQGQIQPLVEIQAAERRIQSGVSNIALETAAISGLDWEDVHRQRALERRMRIDAGLESEEIDPASGKKGMAVPKRTDAGAAESEEEAAA